MTHSLYLFGTALQAEVLCISLPETSSRVMAATLSIAFQAVSIFVPESVYWVTVAVTLRPET